MSTNQIAKIDELNLISVCERLGDGQCIGLPTETVYGLAADATNGLAVAKIFDLKQRPRFNPLICHVSDLEMAITFGVFDPQSIKLAETFWPGPLTLVVPLKEEAGIHPLVSAGLETVGLRCPKGPAGDIISAFGKPLAAPSANRSGRLSPTTADHIDQQFPDADLLIVDTGSCEVGLESTIVKVLDEKLVILRPGSITREILETAVDVPVVESDGNKIEAPGMMKSHYAPDAGVVLNCTECPEGSALLKFGNAYPKNRNINALNLSESGDLIEAAANLYSHLQKLDEAGVDQICVEPVPDTGLGVAINDRLSRAAAPREPT